MSSEWFETYSTGKTMKSAFKAAVKDAEYDYGHRGYTGTIAEKTDFVDLTKDFPKFKDEKEMEEILQAIYHGKAKNPAHEAAVAKLEAEVCDKWGPAGGIRVASGEYLFFGWASS